MAEIPKAEGVILPGWNRRFVEFVEELLPPEPQNWLRHQGYMVTDPSNGVIHDRIMVSYSYSIPHRKEYTAHYHTIRFLLGRVVAQSIQHSYGIDSTPRFLLEAGGIELKQLPSHTTAYFMRPNLMYLMQKRDMGHLRPPGQEPPRGVSVALVH